MNKQQEGEAFERLVFDYDKVELKYWEKFTKLADDLFAESDLQNIWANSTIDH